MQPDSTIEFYRQLEGFQSSFNAMQPELEVCIRDPSIGLEGYVVVWNTAISKEGPLPYCGKGGTRIREGLSLDEVKMLSRIMAIKNAVAGLPLGGAKSGINANPKEAEFEKKYRRFVTLCKPLLHENGGPFGGFGFDVGGFPKQAIWACETLGSTRSFTGKPVAMGGTNYDHEGIAGLGVAEAAATAMELNGDSPVSMRFAVHGLGSMGAAVVRYFSEKRAQLVAIGDPKYLGSWRFKRAISTELTAAIIAQSTDKVLELLAQEGELISDNPNAVLFEALDALFPCALHSVITEENVREVKTRYLIEGANGPCDVAAFPVLYQKGTYVVPDFIANAGGIISAFVELTSRVSNEENAKTGAKVNEAKQYTRAKISENIRLVNGCAKQFQVPFRDAGLYIALNKILHG